MTKKAIIAVLAVLGLVLGATSATGAAPPERRSYIVVLQPGTPQPDTVAAELARSHGGDVGFVYEHAVKGFSVTTTAQGAAGMARNPRVAYIETDDPVSIDSQATPTGIQRAFADTNGKLDIDGSDDYRVDVDVAVIDTGIDFQHPELDVRGGVTCTESGGRPWSRTASCASGGDDDHYHGTHVAGTIAAIDNGSGVVGVAPGARLWAVKVLSSSGSGSESMVVAGIDWVAANADTIEVANMSLGGSGYSQAEYDAIRGAVNKGVAFAVAAGNSDADANNYSPAAFDNVLSVSALADFDGKAGALGSPTCRTDQDDTLADFSNWGTAVDIAAPGVCILSTYPIEQGEYGTISGTSMASPHVAGALALLASSSNPGNAADVTNLYNSVTGSGNFDWTDDSGDGLREPLLDVRTFGANLTAGSGGGGTTNTAPVVSIASPAGGASFSSGTSISFAGSATDNESGDVTSSLVWNSDRDGEIGTGGSFSNVLSDGAHIITATASDGSLTGSSSVEITVGSSSSTEITLNVFAGKDKGVRYADLTWSPAVDGGTVTVYRDGTDLTTTDDDGAYRDSYGGKGGGSANYHVCRGSDPVVCSNTVTASW